MAKTQLTNFILSILPVPPQTLEHIVSHFEERTLLKNEFLLKEGKVSNEYFFLQSGFMRAFTLDTDGNQVTTYFHSEHKVVFEVSSFFTRTVSTENIQALSDCKGFAISYENLNMLFHSIPEFRDFGRAILVKEFAAFKQRTLNLINKSAEERYEDLIKTNKAVFQHAQLKHIASYLGITDTSLSRIRKEFLKK